MKINKEFRKLHSIKRHKHHPIIHHIHKKHRISYQTIFYMKEYGTKSHATMTIIRESVKIILLAAIISSAGGIGLEHIKEKFIALLPFLIMLPALNDMVGDYGTIVSSKFTSMIYTGKVNVNAVTKSTDLRRLAKTVIAVAFISSIYISIASYAIAYYQGFPFDVAMLVKISSVAVLSTIMLVSIIFFVSVIAGVYVYRHKEDPNNFLIPITTAVADLATMLLFTFLIVRFF